MLNFYQWCKTPSSAFSKKNFSDDPHFFQRRPPIFLNVFVAALVIYKCALYLLKTLAPSARYSTFKYPVTLKLGLGVTQGHRKL